MTLFFSLEEFINDATVRMEGRDETFRTLDITNPIAENHLEGERSRFSEEVTESLSNEQIVDLLQAAAKKGCKVNELFLCFFEIGHEVSLALVNLFQDKLRRWERLSIQRCGGGRVWHSCLALIASRGNIESLGLYHNDLGYTGFSTLAMVLASNPTNLNTLEIEEYISPTSAESLGAGLQFNRTLRVLSLSDSLIDNTAWTWIAEGISAQPHLEELYLQRCQITDEDCASILEEIVDHPSIKELRLDYNYCGEQTLQAISTCLQNNYMENLRTLSLHHQSSIFDPSVLNPLPVGVLIGLCYNTVLQTLSLSYNDLSPPELEEFMLLVTESRIQRLDLAACRIDDNGLHTILMNIPRSLKALDVTENLFAGEYAEKLLLDEALLNLSLETLEIDQDLDCWKEVNYLTRLNSAGRRLLVSRHPVPLGLWPIVLDRVNNRIEADSEIPGFQEDMIFAFLQGPAFCGR